MSWIRSLRVTVVGASVPGAKHLTSFFFCCFFIVFFVFFYPNHIKCACEGYYHLNKAPLYSPHSTGFYNGATWRNLYFPVHRYHILKCCFSFVPAQDTVHSNVSTVCVLLYVCLACCMFTFSPVQ